MVNKVLTKSGATKSETGSVISRDGTEIAYERVGAGPPVVIVDGAFCSRAMGTGKNLAPILAKHFTTYIYDRRGRGGSGDTTPYSVDREVEDLCAVISAAGGEADVFGHSSGASLALEAARQGAPIRRLVLYEAPMVVDNCRPPVEANFRDRLQQLIVQDCRSAAIKLFMTEGVRVPKIMTVVMPIMPMWSQIKSIAHTITYDTAFVEEYLKGRPLPSDRWPGVDIPTLVLVGGKSPNWMKNAMTALAKCLPNAQLQVLERQTHMLKPKATGPALYEFLANR